MNGFILNNGDNNCGTSSAKSSENLKRFKHMDICTHFIREIALSGHESVRHVNLEDSEADGRTEPPGATKFEKFRSMVCAQPLL